MAAIQFDSGVKEYTINDKFTIQFNPTDTNFARKLYGVFDDLDKKEEAYRNMPDEGGEAAFERNRARDRDIRASIDGVLGSGASAALFGDINAYALADGLPIWANLMLAIIDEMDASIKGEQKKTNPRVEKYTARYK